MTDSIRDSILEKHARLVIAQCAEEAGDYMFAAEVRAGAWDYTNRADIAEVLEKLKAEQYIGNYAINRTLQEEIKTHGPFDKEMRRIDGVWSWLSYKDKWIGEFTTQAECEENICIHCGD